MKKNLLYLPTLFTGICLMLFTCTTDDILPALNVSLSNNSLSEESGTVILTASLNGAATQQIVIPLTFSGNATLDADYSISANAITINNGQTSGSITITGLVDGLIEGDETIDISIGNASGVLLLSETNFTITILDADIDSDGDGVPDASDECPNVPGDINNNGCPFVGFIINEVLYDPADGIAGDSNLDGTRDPLADEFIEFYNSTANSLDLSGYTISDASQVRHIFPAGTVVPSNGVIVVFGGGNPTGSFGGAIVQTASEGQLNMNNAGDFVTVRDAANNAILTFDINPLSGNPNEAYTRFPDIYGDFERYSNIPEANGALHTPGTKVDGSTF
ncbi:endonuclease [Paucihalobacter ruber]|uniref:Endonuclease n=1 Tax=Paucihalobacter ruber TaxID=2567861 RepID=A0A506PJR3_9FLAO|nr:lamin tail domain-containing protein [Paucihalobacter ruber]TPV34043.1 endonuclease [Paucihalobacter ruber]